MRRHTQALLGLVLSGALIAGACGGDDDDTSTDAGSDGTTGTVPDGPAISIGAQDFGESAILAEIYAQALTEAGFDASVTEVGGYRDLLFGAFESGDVNLAPDYVASQLEFLNDFAGEATSDVDETFALLEPLLAEQELARAEENLELAAARHNLTSKWWGTFNQIKACGACVRRGEKATRVVLWKPINRKR